jgi:hypothetical protein
MKLASVIKQEVFLQRSVMEGDIATPHMQPLQRHTLLSCHWTVHRRNAVPFFVTPYHVYILRRKREGKGLSMRCPKGLGDSADGSLRRREGQASYPAVRKTWTSNGRPTLSEVLGVVMERLDQREYWSDITGQRHELNSVNVVPRKVK